MTKEAKVKKKFSDLSGIEQYEFAKKEILSRQKRKVNFTNKFKFGDEIYDQAFNDKINENLEMQTIMADKKKDLTKKFYGALRHRILHKDHIIIIFFGRTNSAKSWSSLRLAYDIRKMFKKLLQNDSEIHLCFSDSEYVNIIPKMEKMDIMIRDETPKISGAGTNILQKNLDNISAITRAGQYCFFFLSPSRINADVVTYYLESSGIWREEGLARFLLYNDEMRFLGRIYLKRPDDDQFLKDYENRKAKNIEKIKDLAGLVNVQADSQKFNDDKEKLLRICRENGANRKTEIRAMIQKFNFQHPDDGISGFTGYLQDLVNLVYLERRKKAKSTKIAGVDFEEEIAKEIINFDFSDFKFDVTEDKIIETIVNNSDSLKWKYPTRDTNIYLSYNSGVKQIDLTKEHNLSKAAISTIVKNFRGRISKFSGDLLEIKFVEYLKSKNFFDKIERIGEKSNPDVIGYKGKAIYIFSLKLRTVTKYPVIFNKQSLQPEYQRAFKYKFSSATVYLFLVFYDHTNNILRIRTLDPTNPQSQRFNSTIT